MFKEKGLINNSKATQKLRWEFHSFIHSFIKTRIVTKPLVCTKSHAGHLETLYKDEQNIVFPLKDLV